MASTLFDEETYRAAFAFDLEEDDLDFDDEVFVLEDFECAFTEGFAVE